MKTLKIIYAKSGLGGKLYFLSDDELYSSHVVINTEEDFARIEGHVKGNFKKWKGQSFIIYNDGNDWRYIWVHGGVVIQEYEEISSYTYKHYIKKTLELDIGKDIERVNLIRTNTKGSKTPFWDEDVEIVEVNNEQ